MNNTTTTMTPAIQWIGQGSVMPVMPSTSAVPTAGVLGLDRTARHDSALVPTAACPAVVRLRSECTGVAVKGHLGFVGTSADAATIPGHHAWSPPPC